MITVGRVHTQHPWSAARNIIARNALTAGTVSTAWGTANKAFHVPIVIEELVAFNKFYTLNGATASGNIDIGVYDENNSLVKSTGSTAQSGTNVLQEISVTEFVLKPGFYRLALALSSATGTIFCMSLVNADNSRPYDLTEEASAFPLPSTATPVLHTSGFFMPMIGIIRSNLA